MKTKFLLFFLSLLAFTVSRAQDDWQPLNPDQNKAGLELNPLKGIAANFESDNQFPHSISNATFTFGELVNDDRSINYQIIDKFLERQAQQGHVGMIQINIDNGNYINPLVADYYDGGELDEFGNPLRDEEGNLIRELGPYKGHQHDLPEFLSNVKRIYYAGRDQTQAGQTIDNLTVFPWISTDGAGNSSMLPDYNDNELITAVEALIAALGARYDNDGKLFIVHYGIYGIFGEWDLGSAKAYINVVDPGQGEDDWKMTFANQERVINAYQNAFKVTKLVARVPELPQPQSVGYSDGLFFGGSVSDDPQFEFFFHPKLRRFNVDKNWKNQIIGGEMDPELQPTIWGRDMGERDDFDFIVNGDEGKTKGAPDQNVEEAFSLIHPTFIFQNFMLQQQFVGLSNGANFGRGDDNPSKNPTPPNTGPNTLMWENALKVNKKLGYTFHINEFRLSASESKPVIEVNIQNKGIAPMYADWQVEFGYLNNDNNFVTLGTAEDWSLSSIQPQIVEGVEVSSENYRLFSSQIEFPEDDTYTIGLRVVNPLAVQYPNSPPVRFANETQDQHQEGWLTLGEVTIVNGESENAAPVAVTGIEATPVDRTVNMIFFDTVQLTATAAPANASSTDIIWESSNPNIATVDNTGKITTNTLSGEVEITALTSNPEVKAIFTINIAPYIELAVPTKIEAEDYLTLFGTDDDNDVFNDPRVGGFIDEQGNVLRFIENLKPNSYIEYGVSIPDGINDFEIDFRGASPFGATINIQVLAADGLTFNTISTISLPALSEAEFPRLMPGDDGYIDDPNEANISFGEAFRIYKTTTSSSISLPAGNQTIRLQGDGFNLDWIEFKEFIVEYTVVPGRIEAEDFSNMRGVTVGAAPAGETSAEIVENFDDGDWIEYAVDIQGNENKDFKLDFRASSPFGGTATVQLLDADGITFNTISTTALPVLPQEEFIFGEDANGNPTPDFGAIFKIYKTTQSEVVTLPPGKHILRLLPGSYNLNWIDFKEVETAPEYTIIPNRIEAETAQITILDDGTTDNDAREIDTTQGEDAGGKALGSLQNGDQLQYNVTVEAGGADFTLDFRVAGKFSDGQMRVLNASGAELTTVPFSPNSDDFDIYKTFTSSAFTLPEGDQTLILEVSAPNFNLNWIEFKKVDIAPEYTSIPNRIEAETAQITILDDGTTDNDAREIDTTQGEDAGGKALGSLQNGDQLQYNVTVEAGGADFTLDFRVAGKFSDGQMRVLNESGAELTTVLFSPNSDDFDIYKTFTSDEFSLQEGDQTLTLEVLAPNFNLNWIQFRENTQEPEDTEAPIISLIGDALIDLNAGDVYEEQGATAQDNIDGDLSASIVVSGDVVDTTIEGVYIVTYDVVDAAGNTSEQVTRTVNVIAVPDTEAPVISIVGDILIDLNVGDVYEEQGATAQDNVDGDLSTSVVVGGDVVDTTAEGVYIVTYDVSDAAGNVAEQVTRTVNVIEVIVPPTELSVTKFILVDANSNQDIKELVEGDVLDISELSSGNLSIRVETTDDVASVAIALSGPLTRTRNESYKPFTLFGDSSSGTDYNGRTFVVGYYTVSADPYSERRLGGTQGNSLSLNFELIDSNPTPVVLDITKFILVDADSDEDIKELVEGDVLDISELSSDNLSIRVETTDEVGSVAIALTGPVSKTRNESYKPFSLFGDSSGGSDFKGRTFTVGNYTISADSYSERRLNGTRGNSLSLNFELINTNPAPLELDVTRFILVDADSNEDIQELLEGDKIILSDLSSDNLSIRVETTDEVGSVSMALNGPVSKTRNENYRPFALFGDSSSGTDYNGRTFVVGSYTISADTYSERRQEGIQGNSLSVNFSVEQGSLAGKSASLTASINDLKIFPNSASVETTLSFDKPTTVGDIYVFDLAGRLVRTVKGGRVDKEGIPLNVQEMKQGLYFVKTTDTKGTQFQQRLLIERH